MGLPTTDLDDRTFQSLVDEAKRLVQRSSPEWTDHNVSDPGVTLIEAFAQMVDQLIYRVNRMPDRHYVKFLELIGTRLHPPAAAHGTVTFWLAAPQPAPVLVRVGTEVATARTDAQEPVTFTTTADLSIIPADLAVLATSTPGGEALDDTHLLGTGQTVPAFAEVPVPGDSLLIGLTAAVPGCAVLLRIDCPVGGIGIDPRNPPLVWEAWTGRGWSPCDVDTDGTGGLNRPGDVVLHVPTGHEESLLARQRAGWLRCRVLPPDGERSPYTRTPRIAGLRAMTIGGTARIMHAETVRDEELGRSDGTPGQRFALARGPVVLSPEEAGLTAVDPEGRRSTYRAVNDFARSGPDDEHYRLDPVAGEVEFGPAVRQPDGSLRQYGAVPRAGSTLTLSRYRIGGGRSGNLGAGLVRVLKTSVPYVSRVQSRHPSTGGVEPESMANARERAPLELGAGNRAVTAEDFELLARQVAPDAARVACLPAGAANGVRLLVVPRVVTDEVGRAVLTDLTRPAEELLTRIAARLDACRLVGTRLVVEPPAYQGVTVVARMTATADARPARVQEAALRALYAFLSPEHGGPDGDGWPFGRAVQAFDLSGVLARVEGLDRIEELLLFPAQPDGSRGAPVARIDLGPAALAYSYQHQVRVQPGRR